MQDHSCIQQVLKRNDINFNQVKLNEIYFNLKSGDFQEQQEEKQQ